MNKQIWLILSIALNAILIGFVIKLVATRPHHPEPASAVAATRPAPVNPAPPSRPGRTEWPVPAGEPAREPVAETKDAGAAPQFVASGELADLVGKLRAAGVSEETLRAVVMAEVSRQWSERWREVQRKIRRGELDPRVQQDYSGQWQALNEAALRNYLGEEAVTRWKRQMIMQRLNLDENSLPAPQLDALIRAQEDFDRRNRELSTAFQAGEVDPVDYQETQSNRQKEYDQQMRAMLGERYDDVKVSSDWQYGQLRRDLSDLNLSTAQLDALYRATKEFNERQAELQRPRDGKSISGDQWRELQNAKEQQFQQVLGPQAYAEYQKLQDNRYKQMKQYAPAWQLTPGDINHVYDTLTNYKQAVEDYQKEARAMNQSGQPVDWQQVQEGVKDFTRETEQELRRYLGEERFNKLKRSGVIQLPNYQ